MLENELLNHGDCTGPVCFWALVFFLFARTFPSIWQNIGTQTLRWPWKGYFEVMFPVLDSKSFYLNKSKKVEVSFSVNWYKQKFSVIHNHIFPPAFLYLFCLGFQMGGRTPVPAVILGISAGNVWWCVVSSCLPFVIRPSPTMSL